VALGTPAWDDAWYQRSGILSGAGTYVSPESAMRLAAVFACVRVVSETIGSLPLVIYRRRPGGGKERADNHPLYDVFQKPNLWQTAFEFWEMMQGHLELRGNAFAEIVSGNGRAIDQLIPLHPDRVRVFRLPDGHLRYEVTSYWDASITKLAQQQMLHLRGLSSDGIMGLSTIAAGAEVVGTGLAQQDYRGRFFSNNAKPGLALTMPGTMKEEARERLQKSINEGFTRDNAFKTMVLPPGMTVTALGLTNKDSQLIEASQANRTDIASMFRLPPHKIGDLTRGTFSNIEQQNIEFATDSIRPRVVRLERRIDRDLIDPISEGMGAAAGEFFAVFDMDALFRGDMKSRYEAYNMALQYWLTVDEVREIEGKNPIGGAAAELIRPANMQPANGTEQPAGNLDVPNPDDSGSPGSDDSGVEDAAASMSHFRALIFTTAGRVARREAQKLRRIAERVRAGKADLQTELSAFYEAHADVIAESLVLPAIAVERYTQNHLALLASAKEDAFDQIIDGIEEDGPRLLANLALAKIKPKLRASA
jgi:HK97 family phage portal protein